MIHPFDVDTFNAYEQILAQADPPDLPRRAHVRICDGDPNRRATRYPHILTGWLQRHYMDVDGENGESQPQGAEG